MVIDRKTKQIVCTAHGKGKEHDFKLLKNSKTNFLAKIKCLADKGYQGIQKIHSLSQVPYKKPKGQRDPATALCITRKPRYPRLVKLLHCVAE